MSCFSGHFIHSKTNLLVDETAFELVVLDLSQRIKHIVVFAEKLFLAHMPILAQRCGFFVNVCIHIQGNIKVGAIVAASMGLP